MPIENVFAVNDRNSFILATDVTNDIAAQRSTAGGCAGGRLQDVKFAAGAAKLDITIRRG
jgi:hypothetical protein